jgi:endoglucanase
MKMTIVRMFLGALICILSRALSATAGTLAGSPGVAVDQVGYLPYSSKFAFSSQSADSFWVVQAATGARVFQGSLESWKSNDPPTGHGVFRADFSSLHTQGFYRVVTSHGDTSSVFAVSDSVYDRVYRTALKGFYFQRCGLLLASAFAGAYQHPACHLLDGVFHSSSDTSGFHLATGGWHDAGDYGKYVVNAGISVGTLLLAYDLFPLRFADDDLGIPESGNGVPDILDEARYELQWILLMQRADGGFWFKLTREQFAGFIMPQADTGTRYLYAVSTAATGDATAVLAIAARLFASYDADFAQTCLDAGKRGWQFLAAHPGIVPSGGFRNPSGTATGEYGDADDSDERLWAASELFETTGETPYHEFFLTNYALGPEFTAPMWWGDVRPLGLLTYLRSKRSDVSGSVHTELRQSLLSFCSSQIAKRNASGYQVLLQSGDYVWGSNSVALNAAVLLLAGSAESGDTLALAVAQDQLHYVLGANGLSRSFVTGLGEHPPRQPHHRPSAADGIVEPVPGLLAGGPNQYGGDPVLQALINTGTPPALCYVDTVASYASNEIAINWNAPLVFVAGYLRSEGRSDAVPPVPPGKPSGVILNQNYPNPFNGTTRFRFTTTGKETLELRIQDLLGREVTVIPLGRPGPGTREVVWDAVDRAGYPLSSGVYFSVLEWEGGWAVRKFILLR